jgi:hypothetical protein
MRAGAASEESGPSHKFERIRAVAIAAFGRPYPATAAARAVYWDDLISSFARVHGADLTAKVFGVEVQTARALMLHSPSSLTSLYAVSPRRVS